ncbi:SART-1 family protein [Actinidia chinensis var. chinensis]|uniref:SART-1 family protein n=1 Tax=Actinidia chinensis var. chinensis TaxID=1590841 RepID=A0A2R6RY71_ACTCC|nr:SART-1 family protein [Actinidia chinensis var. chinensis]
MAHSPQPPTLGSKFSKKRKILVADDDASKKEIRIERRDEYGRIMTPREAFWVLSHKLYGKSPGKRAQKKRKKLHEEELRSKQLQFNTNKPSLFMGRMLELQAQSNKPYIILHSRNS